MDPPAGCLHFWKSKGFSCQERETARKGEPFRALEEGARCGSSGLLGIGPGHGDMTSGILGPNSWGFVTHISLKQPYLLEMMKYPKESVFV